ncbi:hypothetical protein OCG87_001862, partial [Acinetobacter baumannii]|nr:hypothetical protein [Acinetobacter baumannii]
LGKINEEGWKAWLKETGKGVITTVLATIALWLLLIALNKGQSTQDEYTKKYLPTGDVPAASTPK